MGNPATSFSIENDNQRRLEGDMVIVICSLDPRFSVEKMEQLQSLLLPELGLLAKRPEVSEGALPFVFFISALFIWLTSSTKQSSHADEADFLECHDGYLMSTTICRKDGKFKTE